MAVIAYSFNNQIITSIGLIVKKQFDSSRTYAEGALSLLQPGTLLFGADLSLCGRKISAKECGIRSIDTSYCANKLKKT